MATGRRYIPVGTRATMLSQWQWQPTLTSHNPNPPITINSPAAPPASGSQQLLTLLGVGS